MKKKLWLTVPFVVVFTLAFVSCAGVVRVKEVPLDASYNAFSVFINGENGGPTLASLAGKGRTIKFFILEFDVPSIPDYDGGCLSIMLGGKEIWNWEKNFRDSYDLSNDWTEGDKAYYVFDPAQLPTYSDLENALNAAEPADYQGRIVITGYKYTDGVYDYVDNSIFGNYKLYATTQNIAGGPPGAVEARGSADNGATVYDKVVGYYVKNLKLNIID
jgi:hypothetical protein